MMTIRSLNLTQMPDTYSISRLCKSCCSDCDRPKWAAGAGWVTASKVGHPAGNGCHGCHNQLAAIAIRIMNDRERHRHPPALHGEMNPSRPIYYFPVNCWNHVPVATSVYNFNTLVSHRRWFHGVSTVYKLIGHTQGSRLVLLEKRIDIDTPLSS